MRFMIRIDRKDNDLKRLLRGWFNPAGKHHRRIPEEVGLEKWGHSVYTANLTEYALRLFAWLQDRKGKDKVKLYIFEPVTPKQLEAML